ncbi:MAG TPA: molybdopterin biosynthesis protein MoeY [Casimicrobiaceae bacterium]|nr:molybdopterin biosynthesis protein MoeY [Casimicrobiaceae bacterium]
MLALNVLELARWAPSGDNTQPWRFEVASDREILVHGHDTRETCVYDLDGWASQLAHGALLETIAVAATQFGAVAHIGAPREVSDRHIVYPVRLDAAPAQPEDPRVAYIAERTVQRRTMRATPLTEEQRGALETAARPYRVLWFASARDRRRMAQLSFRSAFIRLTTPEAYAVHRDVIAWHAKTSEDRLPDAALGADPVLLHVMRWAMKSWSRVDRLNRFAGGTWMPRISLDVIPALACSAHFVMIADAEPTTIERRIDAGRHVQRFWLEATRLGLQIQPNYTPLVFARYARERRRFTTVEHGFKRAEEIDHRLRDLVAPKSVANAVFMGRIGPSRPVAGRSIRLPLERLIMKRDVANVT